MNKTMAQKLGYVRGLEMGDRALNEILESDDYEFPPTELVYSDLAYEMEAVDREYSPFEFLAHDINEQADADELWDIFDDAISEGIFDKWQEFYNENNLHLDLA